MYRLWHVMAWSAFVAFAGAEGAWAETPPGIESVVVSATPLAQSDVAADRLPESFETLDAEALRREGTASLTMALNDQLGAINVNDNLDDPFQPDILYRGFEASPVLGTPQGLAVYQDGVRINEAFGDTVNWDLVPDMAIARIDVLGTNPVFGLNALGGSVSIRMKNGFDDPAAEGELTGGSWARREGSAQYGTSDGAWGVYVAGRWLAENGWREFSPDSVEQFYGDIGYRTATLSFDLSLTAADNALDGESPSPVQELAVDRTLVFTSPQSNRNRLLFPALRARYAVDKSLSLQAGLYFRAFRQSVINGNTTNYIACMTTPGFLCQPDGLTPLMSTAGAPIPDISDNGAVPIGENDLEEISTNAFGGSLQATDTAAFFRRENHLSAGATFDHDSTAFGSQAELGTVNAALQVARSGLFVLTPEGSSGPATPVALDAVDRYYGVFATDTLNVTPDIAVTASGRYNLAEIRLADLRGQALSGSSRYGRFNPAIGATDAVSQYTTVYAGYSEGNRVPTPGEIECANPLAPCLLPSSLSSDPPTLKQVVSRSIEAGVRGRWSDNGAELSWHAELFRTNVDDDIYGVATSLSSGYFRNIGQTRREGAELGLHYDAGPWFAFVSYDYVAATFQSPILLPSLLNTGADANGDIHVMPGDRLPGIPAHRLKLGADYRITHAWSFGGVVVIESGQYLRGDESNQMKPLAGFATVNVHSAYDFGCGVELFVQVFNLFDARYATFGELGDPTGVGAPGIPSNPNAVAYRFESPAAPRSVFGGVRVTL